VEDVPVPGQLEDGFGVAAEVEAEIMTLVPIAALSIHLLSKRFIDQPFLVRAGRR